MKNTLVLLLLTILACDPPGDARLMLENNSSSSIIFIMGRYQPDTVKFYKFYDCSSSKDAQTYLEPGERDGYPTGPGNNWETLLPKYPASTLIFLAYHSDSASKYIDKYDCDSLGKRKDLILKRFDVTVDYLDNNNWTLSYP